MNKNFHSNDKASSLIIPLAIETVSAGFPSPAEDFLEHGIDLNKNLIKNPISTFFLRVTGNSMIDAGIHDNDLLIVDRSINANPGHIVVANLEGEFTLKRLIKNNTGYYLKAERADYPSIDLIQFRNIQIWGVAIYSIHKL